MTIIIIIIIIMSTITFVLDLVVAVLTLRMSKHRRASLVCEARNSMAVLVFAISA